MSAMCVSWPAKPALRMFDKYRRRRALARVDSLLFAREVEMSRATSPSAFLKRFGLQVPIVGAAMSGHAGFELAAAVARAGGFGFIGAARYPEQQLREEYNKAQNLREGRGALGIGLLSFAIKPELLDAVIALRPQAVWLAAGTLQPHFQKLTDADIPVIAQVNTLEEVQNAVRLGAAAIIAQGDEAGGHGRRFASTISFVPEAADAITNVCKDLSVDEVPLLAAGGIVDSRQVAASLVLGAQAAVLGTRLVATHEAPVQQWTKAALVNAGSQASERPATVTTGLFDELDAPDLRAKFGDSWPLGCIARTLQTPFTDMWGQKEHLLEGTANQLRKEVAVAKSAGDLSVAPVWSGSSVGLIHSVEPAEQLVAHLARSASKILQQTSISAEF